MAIEQLREIIHKANEKSYDKTSLFLTIMEMLDYYDKHTSINKKNKIKAEYGIKD